jgi:hypothetical protein
MTGSVTETGDVQDRDSATESPGQVEKALHTILMRDPNIVDASMITSVMEPDSALDGDGVKESLDDDWISFKNP